MVQNISRKERLYNFIAGNGIKVIQAIFPEYFAKEPVRPTDRYIEYPFVLKNIPKPPGDILDVGCSGSMFPLLLEALGYNVWAIDIRDYKMPFTTKVNFNKGDICNTCIINECFDIVTAISTIEHIGLKSRYGVKKDYEADMKAMNGIYRILKHKGMLLMTVPIDDNFKLTKNHRVYNMAALKDLLRNFKYTIKKEKSPEADYDIALIRAVKCTPKKI